MIAVPIGPPLESAASANISFKFRHRACHSAAMPALGCSLVLVAYWRLLV